MTMAPEGVTEESTVESTDAWKCECGTVNDPEAEDLADDADPDVCKNCGKSAFDQPEVLAELTIDAVKAGLQNISGGVATSQDIENAARAEEGLPPMEAAGLLDFGPFNSDNALKAIFEKQAEVRSLQADYDRKKEIAKDTKGELDIASKALVNIIESLKNRRTQALNPSQPFLKDVSGDAVASAENMRAAGISTCPWEREHPGQSCPICTRAQAEDLVPALESEVHPDHEGHAAIAEAARVKNVLLPMVDELARVTIFVTVEDLQPLSVEDLNALREYATEPSPIPPQILVRSCVAAEPGSLIQVCQRCERILRNDTEGLGWFAVDVRVGLSCEVAPQQVEPEDVKTAPPAETTEATRTIKPRGSKKRAKKEPEQERARQADAGRKAAASTPKKGKAKAATRAKGRK